MVCVLLKEDAPPDKPDMVKKNLCTMVHVFSTNSWREIPQVPSYPITGKAVFANGCLHWLASYSDIKTKDGRRPVIWFDVEKEEFGLIDPPKIMCDKYSCRYQVVDLNGEVGYVCARTMEVWLLNHKKEWVPHCRFKEEIVPHGYIDVIGCWNKDGDILIRSICGNPLMTNTQTPPPATIVVIPTGAPATNTMANHAERPEKFNGQNFKRWQQEMFFYLTTLGLARFLKETAPQVEPPAEGQSSDAQAMQAVEAWKHPDFLCHNYVLNGLIDPLYNMHCKTTTAKEL
ncbi:F-box domain containing protein [Tanacetum coccineum]